MVTKATTDHSQLMLVTMAIPETLESKAGTYLFSLVFRLSIKLIKEFLPQGKVKI